MNGLKDELDAAVKEQKHKYIYKGVPGLGNLEIVVCRVLVFIQLLNCTNRKITVKEFAQKITNLYVEQICFYGSKYNKAKITDDGAKEPA